VSRTLRAGDRGLDVYQWQAFLQGRGEPLQPVGAFDEPTVSATRRFQSAHGLPQTGEADAATLGAARTLGLVQVDYWADDPGYPALPDFGPLTDNASRMVVFGAFEFAAAPRPDNPEAIRFRDDWVDRQLVTVELAQLRGLPGRPPTHGSDSTAGPPARSSGCGRRGTTRACSIASCDSTARSSRASSAAAPARASCRRTPSGRRST